jgi:hypothetical protein
VRNPCLDCGRPADATRCPVCTTRFERGRYRTHDAARKANGGRPQYAGGWRTYAAHVRATATSCWICGQGPKADDPFQADHIIPVSKGGGEGAAAAAHRSCNIGRANKLRAGKADPALRTGRNANQRGVAPHRQTHNQQDATTTEHPTATTTPTENKP